MTESQVLRLTASRVSALDDLCLMHPNTEDLRHAADLLQRGDSIPRDILLHLADYAARLVKSNPSFADREPVYLFIVAIMSSVAIDPGEFEELPCWASLYDFAKEFDAEFWPSEEI